MYILCNIPDKTYKKIVEKCVNSQIQAELTMPTIVHNIANGIVLKPHGPLVDVNEVIKNYAFEKKTNSLKGDDDAFLKAIQNAQVIIEATEEDANA